MGGDHTLKRIEAHVAPILATSKQQPRLFLREIRRRLVQQSVQNDTSVPTRFCQRTGSPERWPMSAAEHERADSRAAREALLEAQPELVPDSWCSWTGPRAPPTWRGAPVGHCAAPLQAYSLCGTAENQNHRRRFA